MRDQNEIFRDPNGTLERLFALNLYPDNATFGTVYIELWPTYTSETTVIAEYETRPPVVTSSIGTGGTVAVPRDCMLYYLGWRLALESDDNKRFALFARRRRLTTKTKHRTPHYGGVFYDIRQSRRIK
jgi:hypothetical protein